MTEGHETCGQASGGRNRPQRGRTTSSFAPVRPLRGRLERVSAIRRFHDLRSFHPRLFTFAPFGDGRMLLAKLEYFSVSKYDIFKYRIRCIIIKKSGIIHAIVCPDFFYLLKSFLPKKQSFLKSFLPKINLFISSLL